MNWLGDGSTALQVPVRAIAEKGRANDALIAVFAKAIRRPKRAFSIVTGATSRTKVLRVEGDANEIAAALETAAAQRKEGK